VNPTTYANWTYLFPPRPENAITANMLGYYEGKNWVAQYKKNGQLAVIGIGPDGFEFMNRHRDELNWNPTVEICSRLREIFGSDKWTVLVGELLHNKVIGQRDGLYLFDILVLDGEYLVGETLGTRMAYLMHRIQPYAVGQTYCQFTLSPNLGVAYSHDMNFRGLFDGISDPADEGLVLKDPSAPLNDCYRSKANASWQVKCRHPKENYIF
jgi:hypothetical protein